MYMHACAVAYMHDSSCIVFICLALPCIYIHAHGCAAHMNVCAYSVYTFKQVYVCACSCKACMEVHINRCMCVCLQSMHGDASKVCIYMCIIYICTYISMCTYISVHMRVCILNNVSVHNYESNSNQRTYSSLSIHTVICTCIYQYLYVLCISLCSCINHLASENLVRI